MRVVVLVGGSNHNEGEWEQIMASMGPYQVGWWGGSTWSTSDGSQFERSSVLP